jgi:hypothetical protein
MALQIERLVEELVRLGMDDETIALMVRLTVDEMRSER